MFCIVDFKGGRTRTVVPDTWLSINDTHCLLPHNATDNDVEVLARNLAEPGEGWQMLEVSSVETFESYSEAKKQLEKSKERFQSEASSQRKRKKPSYLEDYVAHDSDDGRRPYTVFGMDFDEEAMSENEWIPPPEFSPHIENVSSVKKTIRNDHRPMHSRFSQSQLSSQKENIDFTCDCQSSCHSTFLQALRSMQNSMQKQLDRTNQMVQQLLGGQKQTHSQLKRILQNRPVNQMNDQEEMDVYSSQDSTSFVQCVFQNPSTSGAQKRTESATPYSAYDDTYITGDQPSTAEVLEMEFKKRLKTHIKFALVEFPTDDIETVLTTLETLGVKSMDHLKYVQSSDLLDVLNAVQARILVESFQTCSESDVQKLSKLESENQLFQHETKFPEAEKDCVVNISWERMAPELLDDLKANREPREYQYREMVRIIADDILKCNTKASRNLIRLVAESLVKKYPILKDKFEDMVIGTGFETLTIKIASRIDNVRRHHSVSFPKKTVCKMDVTFNQELSFKKRGCALDSYGCIAWAPNLPENETLESLERKKRSLLELEISKDYEKISTLMQDTYCLQRKEINNGADIRTLLKEWPFLFKIRGMLDHFKILTGSDIRQKIESIIDKKCKSIFAFFQSSDKMKVKAFIADNDTTRNRLVLLFITIALHFDEDPSESIRTCEVLNPHDDHKDIPLHPCIIGKGTSALKANEFMLCIDKVVVNSEIKDANFAIMMLFATYYVLNLPYPKSIALTLEFFQRCLIGINPSTGSKAERKRKYYQIHPRLLKVVNKLKIFEEWWSTLNEKQKF